MPATKTDKKSSSAARKKDRSKGEAPVKSSKDKSRRKTDKAASKSASSFPAAPAADAPLPVAADPDAVQLFRRYDRSRTGFLSRVDFLQLVRDYASSPDASTAGQWASRAPLSLTDSRGVPLGYARADRNSEFEAGQLFERYDADRSGALTLNGFLRFFADFQPQLAAFVRDCAYLGVPVAPIASRDQPTAAHAQPEPSDGQPTPTHEESRSPVPTAGDADSDRESAPTKPAAEAKREYQAALWALHKFCKEELDAQRERIVHKMEVLRRETVEQVTRSVGAGSERTGRRTVRFTQSLGRSSLKLDDDDIGDAFLGVEPATALYESLETDLDHIDEITRFLRRHLRRGADATPREMVKFLAHAPVALEEAQYLAMKDYGDRYWRWRSRSASPSRSSSPSMSSPTTPQESPRGGRTPLSGSRNQLEHEEAGDLHPQPSKQPQPQQSHRQRELEELVRVKDQMIYQLLQERAAMRRNKAATESYLKTLSRVSSQEMNKWAKLTDEMQSEIERLRAQLPATRRSR